MDYFGLKQSYFQQQVERVERIRQQISDRLDVAKGRHSYEIDFRRHDS